MSHSARDKWDMRYREMPDNAQPAPVLLNNCHLIPANGEALDLACGLGANALFLARKGWSVDAWDISAVAIEKLNATAQRQGLTLQSQVRDCIAQPPAAHSFDLIIISRFLERTLCPAITAALRPNGLLLYQTYTQKKRGGQGPNNPDFLLVKGELLELFSKLETLSYQEGEEALFVGRKK